MSRPVCTWIFDNNGNLEIRVRSENVVAFGNWINDENGRSEREMYELMEDCRRLRPVLKTHTAVCSITMGPCICEAFPD